MTHRSSDSTRWPGRGDGSSALRPVLVVLVGAPGSGKSTLARGLVAESSPGAVLLSMDALRARLSPWGDEADQSVTTAAAMRLRSELADALRSGRDVVVDATNARARTRRQLLKIARAAAAGAIAVVVRTPLELCLERNARRPASAGPSGWPRRVPEESVRSMHGTISANAAAIPREGWDTVVEVDGTAHQAAELGERLTRAVPRTPTAENGNRARRMSTSE